MIYGNPLIFGSSGGGSGPSASDAILTVTLPTGSTATATKGGVTLTPTMWVQAADATLDCALFVIPAAQFDATTPWTVTATSGTDTATDTVTIDSNKQYDVELSYHYFLYNKGTQFVDRTGGWAVDRGSSVVFQSDHIHLFSGSGYPTLYTVNKVNKLNFTKIAFRVSNSVFGTAYDSGVLIGFGTSQQSFSLYVVATEDGVCTLDISSVTDAGYVNGYCWRGAGGNEQCDIDQIWLE